MTNPLLTITAYGQPAPQGSKRHVGRGIMVESSKAVKPWREAVKAAALDARGSDWAPVDAPLAVSMVFTMPKPANAPKRRRTWPMRTPDLSKLIRSTEDALTDAGIWRDDARVVSYERTAKVYPGEDVDALTSPGVVIRIWLVESEAYARSLGLAAGMLLHGSGTVVAPPPVVRHGDERSLPAPVATVTLPGVA